MLWLLEAKLILPVWKWFIYCMWINPTFFFYFVRRTWEKIYTFFHYNYSSVIIYSHLGISFYIHCLLHLLLANSWMNNFYRFRMSVWSYSLCGLYFGSWQLSTRDSSIWCQLGSTGFKQFSNIFDSDQLFFPFLFVFWETQL